MAKTPEEKQEWLEAILKERERRKGELLSVLAWLCWEAALCFHAELESRQLRDGLGLSESAEGLWIQLRKNKPNVYWEGHRGLNRLCW